MKELLTLIFKGQWKTLFFVKTANGWIQLFRYVFVGGCAFVVDFFSYCGLESVGVHYGLAAIVSFLIGFVVNFLLSRWFIFSQDKNDKKVEWKEFSSVLGISVIGLILTEALLITSVEVFHLDYRVSKVVASLIVLFWNYAARKMFVYKS